MTDFLVVDLRFIINIPGANNLKERRNILRSIKGKIHNNFNVSLVFNEKDNNYEFCKGGISFIVVENSQIDRNIEKITNFIEDYFPVNIVEIKREIY
jgi:hypothetical protein